MEPEEGNRDRRVRARRSPQIPADAASSSRAPERSTGASGRPTAAELAEALSQ